MHNYYYAYNQYNIMQIFRFVVFQMASLLFVSFVHRFINMISQNTMDADCFMNAAEIVGNNEMFRNIVVQRINFQDRKRRFWTNVVFLVKLTGQKYHKIKCYSHRRDVRNRENVLAFCKEIDSEWSSVTSGCFGDESSKASSGALNLSSVPIAKSSRSQRDGSQGILCESADFCKPSSLFQADMSDAAVSRQISCTGRFRKQPRCSMEMKNIYVEVLSCLQYVIGSGNFFTICDGPVLEVENEIGARVLECDLTPFQRAKLHNSATALYWYYSALLDGNSKMSAYEAGRRALPKGCRLCGSSMRRLVGAFEKNNYMLKADMSGHHERRWIVIHDDVWGKELRGYVRQFSVVKGEKNMTVEQFTSFVNSTIIPQAVACGDAAGLPKKIQKSGISLQTARYWLHYIGCYFKQGRKDVYYDGHEREDVVEYRKQFIPRLMGYFNDPDVVVVFQDESIYRANEHNNFFWQIGRKGEAVNNPLRKKGLGYGTMVSGFLTIHGIVGLTDAEMNDLNADRAANGLLPIKMATRVTNTEVDGAFGDIPALHLTYHLFNYGKEREGYWNADLMVAHTKDTIAMLQYKFPGKKFVFLFDWSSGHDKKPTDSVILSKIRLNYGGMQPAMRSTKLLENYVGNLPVYPALRAGDVQHLTFQPGDPPPFYKLDLLENEYIGMPKGAKQIAFERGLWKNGMVLKDDENQQRSCYHALAACPDFQNFVKSALQEEIEKLGHGCDFLPKFHCELNPIERVWAKSKRYVRDHTDYTRETLLRNIPKSLSLLNISNQSIINYCCKTFEYCEAYLRGDSLLLAKMSIPQKSHRRVRPSEGNL